MDKVYTVYIHINRKNGKKYVGITSQKPEDRWLNGNGYKGNRHFDNAIKKYGWNMFDHIIVANNLSKQDAEEMEIELIAKYDSANSDNGYNIQLGGSTSGKHSKETKTKISKSHTGMRHTEETKKKLSNMFKGRKIPKEWRDKITSSQTGLKRTQETCKRIGDALSIPVICINNRIVYKSLTEAASLSKTQIGHISSCCHGKRPRAGMDDNGNGLYWMFYEQYLNNGYENMTNEDIIPKLKKSANKLPIRCIETGVIYESLKEANINTGISKTALSQCLHGKMKTSGGYHWEYVIDGDYNYAQKSR